MQVLITNFPEHQSVNTIASFQNADEKIRHYKTPASKNQ